MLNAEEISFYLSVFKGLDLKDMYDLFRLSKTRKLAAGDIYIDSGTTCQKLAYIKKGLIRAYYLKDNGDEMTIILRWENQFIASHDSIIFKKPSRFTYQALEDTVIMELDYEIAQPILNNNPKLSSTRNGFLMDMLAETLTRVESFVLLTAEERYLQLLQLKPDIINRVPSKYLATLLGVTPVSLSRIRKRIASSRKH